MWVDVESSNIAAVGYQDSQLLVRFKSGAKYVYDKVPKEVFQEIVEADSVGSSFHHLVKRNPDKYPFKRLN